MGEIKELAALVVKVSLFTLAVLGGLGLLVTGSVVLGAGLCVAGATVLNLGDEE